MSYVTVPLCYYKLLVGSIKLTMSGSRGGDEVRIKRILPIKALAPGRYAQQQPGLPHTSKCNCDLT